MNKPVMCSLLGRMNLTLKDLILYGDISMELDAMPKLWFVDQRTDAAKKAFFMELNYYIKEVLEDELAGASKCPHYMITRAILELYDDRISRSVPNGKVPLVFDKLDDYQVVLLEDVTKHYTLQQNRRLRFALSSEYDVSNLDELSRKWVEKGKMPEQRRLALKNTQYNAILKTRFQYIPALLIRIYRNLVP